MGLKRKKTKRSMATLIRQALLDKREETMLSLIKFAPWSEVFPALLDALNTFTQWARQYPEYQRKEEEGTMQLDEGQGLFFVQIQRSAEEHNGLTFGLICLSEAMVLFLEERLSRSRENWSHRITLPPGELLPGLIMTWEEMRQEIEELADNLFALELPELEAIKVAWIKRYTSLLKASFAFRYDRQFLLRMARTLPIASIGDIMETAMSLDSPSGRNVGKAFGALANTLASEGDMERAAAIREWLE